MCKLFCLSYEAPGPVDPPMAAVIDANTLHVTWEQPTRPNGIIRRVNVYQNDLLRTIVSKIQVSSQSLK